jgi:hypothetical protein
MFIAKPGDDRARSLRGILKVLRGGDQVEVVAGPEPNTTPRIERLAQVGERGVVGNFLVVEILAPIHLVQRQIVKLAEDSEHLIVDTDC